MVFVSAAAESSPVLVCPAGHVILVKSLHVNNQHDAAASVQIWLAATEPAFSGATYTVTDIPPNTGVFAEFWFVLNPTDSLYMYCYAPNMHLWLSGAVLFGSPMLVPPVKVRAEGLPAEELPSPR